jgi:HSP20 family molecular chaperone IbpA
MKFQIFVLILLTTICTLKDQFEQIQIKSNGNRVVDKEFIVPNDFFDKFLGFNSKIYPNTRIIGNEDSVLFVFEISGVGEKDFSISLQQRTSETQVLKINGEKKLKTFENGKILQNELFEGKFERKFFLPILELETKIRKSTLENGILEVEILRKKMEKIQIEIK